MEYIEETKRTFTLVIGSVHVRKGRVAFPETNGRLLGESAA